MKNSTILLIVHRTVAKRTKYNNLCPYHALIRDAIYCSSAKDCPLSEAQNVRVIIANGRLKKQVPNKKPET